LPPTLNVCNQPNEQIRTYNAEDVYELLTSHCQKLTPDDHVEIRKQSAAEEAVEPEPGSEERTMTVVKLNERPGPIEDGIGVSEDTDWNEQRVTASAQEIMKMLACYEEAEGEGKFFASAASSFNV
jgi:hypothetical protein